MGYLSRNAHREFRPVEPGVYYRADLGVTADVFSVKELGYGEGRRVYFTWKADNGNSGLSHLPESTFAQVYVRVDESGSFQCPTDPGGEPLPPAADPGDVPSETTLRDQAAGLDAMTAALDLNGPIKPAPYFADTPADADLRLLRQADRGELYLGRESGQWFRRSELDRSLVKAGAAAPLRERGLITATRPVPRTRWLQGELTDTGRAVLAAGAVHDEIDRELIELGYASPDLYERSGPVRRRRARVPRADLDVILSDAYLAYLLGVRTTRPTAAGLPSA